MGASIYFFIHPNGTSKESTWIGELVVGGVFANDFIQEILQL